MVGSIVILVDEELGEARDPLGGETDWVPTSPAAAKEGPCGSEQSIDCIIGLERPTAADVPAGELASLREQDWACETSRPGNRPANKGSCCCNSAAPPGINGSRPAAAASAGGSWLNSSSGLHPLVGVQIWLDDIDVTVVGD